MLVDTGPDFHAQALREGIRNVDAVLYTHGHADHVMGFDDLRPLSFRLKGDLPVYADDETAKNTLSVSSSTPFAKKDRYPTSARVETSPDRSCHPVAGVELFGRMLSAHPGDAWTPGDHGLSLRQRSLPDRYERHPG